MRHTGHLLLGTSRNIFCKHKTLHQTKISVMFVVPKCHSTEMFSTEMSQYRNVSGTEMSTYRNVSGTEMSTYRNVSRTEMSTYRNVSGTEMSTYRNVSFATWYRNVSGTEMSTYRNVARTEMSGTEMSVPKCPWPKYLVQK